MKLAVLFYESAPDVLTKARAHFAAHRAYWESFRADGKLLLIGPFANPSEGSMAVFRTREDAETFARDDPFVLNGVVRDWNVREWNESLGGLG